MKVPQFMPFVDLQEWESIKNCFEINWITEGPKSKQFVDELCKITNVKYGVLAPNGTLALYLGLRALGIGPGDEVIVPTFTFIASANAVEMTGAKPVFVDVHPDDLQIDISKCNELITKNTVAIMPVHLYGFAANMDEVITFASENEILVIEDAAQALGVEWNNKRCGSFGDVACFSFFADKTITTGEGGFVGTNDKNIYDQLLYLRNQGRLNRGSFIHPEIGYNFRMTDIQSAIGLSQLTRFNFIKQRKSKIFDTYVELLANEDWLEVIKPKKEVTSHIPFRTIIMLKHEKNDDLMEYLTSNDIETRTLFYPIDKQPCYQLNSNQILNSNAEYAYDHGICLPSYVALEDEQIKFVCDTIKNYKNELHLFKNRTKLAFSSNTSG